MIISTCSTALAELIAILATTKTPAVGPVKLVAITVKHAVLPPLVQAATPPAHIPFFIILLVLKLARLVFTNLHTVVSLVTAPVLPALEAPLFA
jgi:hypothetical protein